jgi:sigma-B regulation protein RsbU (phosphoserine phosphatase)
MAEAEVISVQQRTDLVILILIGVLISVIAAVSALISRSVVRPIMELHRGTDIIGSGDLEYRVGTEARDEIGDLGRAFDRMVSNLTRVMTSRDRLEAEITARKRVEAALRKHEEELARSNEELEHYARQLGARNAQMADDLNMAREVQQALLPRQYPKFLSGVGPGHSTLRFSHLYRPSALLGGDFFNIHALSNTMAGIFICDVMGHGLRAALVTAVIRGLLEELKPIAGEAGAFLTELNRALMAILKQPDQLIFVTAAYLVVDLREGSVSFANAGHPSPLHSNRQSGAIDWLWPAGAKADPALGILDDHHYVPGSRKLGCYDLIVAFTDGLLEVEGRTGNQFGEERLLEAVRKKADHRLEKMFQEILVEVDEFAGDSGFEDDLCVIGMELTPSGD